MGGRPKKQDYEPSEAEKASAAVARAEKLFLMKTMRLNYVRCVILLVILI